MKNKIILLLSSLAIVTTSLMSCGKKDNAPTTGAADSNQSESRKRQEKEALSYLNKARTYLAQKDFEAARGEIKTMRDTCKLAFTARESGILLMDSIDLIETEDELVKIGEEMKSESDSSAVLQAKFDDLFTKAEFFRRKLEYDRSQKKY